MFLLPLFVASISAASEAISSLEQSPEVLPSIEKRADRFYLDSDLMHRIRLPEFVTCHWDGYNWKYEFEKLYAHVTGAYPKKIEGCDACFQRKDILNLFFFPLTRDRENVVGRLYRCLCSFDIRSRLPSTRTTRQIQSL